MRRSRDDEIPPDAQLRITPFGQAILEALSAGSVDEAAVLELLRPRPASIDGDSEHRPSDVHAVTALRRGSAG